MRVNSIQLEQFRSFESSGPIPLAQINVLIGPNNSGKSSILRALHLIQNGCGAMPPEVRVGSQSSNVTFELSEISGIPHWVGDIGSGVFQVQITSSDREAGNVKFSLSNSNSNYGIAQLPNTDPFHFVVPYLSKRKVGAYQEDVRLQYAAQITNDMSFLAAKLSKVGNPEFPDYEYYRKACKEILGFVVTAVPSANGQRPGAYLPNRQTLPLDQMGEGVSNIVLLLVSLALSQDKLFLIEEPENDLHPNALKALLDLIVQSSKSNQFVVSTHSNIVVRHLASAENSLLYNITTEPGTMPPKATITEVAPTVEARLEVLRELGYSFSDFDLWDGWLVLEEASAERIIRDYLIPWFTPKLSRIRTLSAGGQTQVEATFEDFNRLVRFTHLEEAYRNAAWVRVDGDENGSKIVEKLQKDYSTWNPDNFGTYKSAQFENYYPEIFKDRVDQVLGIKNKQEKRDAKKQLLDDVRVWLDEDKARGKEALKLSAKEIIEDLRIIEKQLIKR